MKTVTGVQAVPHLLGCRIDLTWQNPPNSDFDRGSPLNGIRIVRRERTFPLALDDGDLVYPTTQPILPQSSEPLLAQFSDNGLQPLTTYYYTIFTVDAANVSYADDNSRAAAFATQNYNLSERLYKMLSAVHQRYDALGATQLQPLDQATMETLAALPPNLSGKGQLWRFFYAAAAPMDLMRSFAEGLSLLQNVDWTRPEFLPLLAQWLGWELDRTLPIFAQRNEIKFAPRLYRSVGTIPNLQAIVTHYTGWYTQVAEFAYNIAQSNTPPQLNAFALVQTPGAGEWLGTDDAAVVLGFGAGNNYATITNHLAATLIGTTTGTTQQGFALRPGMELSVAVDGRVPVVVRFQPGDFAKKSSATASEVVAVLKRTLPGVTATASTASDAEGEGHVVLSSQSTGPDSSLQVEQSAGSLVTLEGAPRGRLATFVDRTNRVRLFYETADPLAPLTGWAASQSVSGTLFSSGSSSSSGTQGSATSAVPTAPILSPSLPQGRIHYKTFRSGSWGESYLLPIGSTPAQGEPAAVELPDGRIWVAWVDNPNIDSSLSTPPVQNVRFSVGTPATPQPALLRGQAREPFTITPGTRLLFRGNWLGGEEGFEFVANDFANWQQARAVEVVTALNARLGQVNVTASVDLAKRTLLLATVATGGDVSLEIDLQVSSAAQSLGFGTLNAVASGDWGDAISWSNPQPVTSAPPGLHADLHAVVDGSSVVWLFWANFVTPPSPTKNWVSKGNWQIVDSRWDGTNWSPLEIVANGIGGNREPFAILDNAKHLWLFWSRRQGVGTLEDNWTLEQRVFDGTSWGLETPVTSTPTDGDGRAADREPAAVLLANGDLQVFFRSDRSSVDIHGLKLWSITVTPATGAVTPPPTAITTGYNADHAPSPIQMSDGTLWLLFRSDRSIPLSRVATRSLSTVENRTTSPPPGASAVSALSLRLPDSGTVRRYAGSTSVVPSDGTRNARRGLWDDLLAYTPQNPQGDPSQQGDYYTRGTVGLYLSQLTPANPLSTQKVERLLPVLQRFLPINARADIFLVEAPASEYVYQAGAGGSADIQDSYQDQYPFVAHAAGLEGSTAVAQHDLELLHSNTPGEVSPDPTDLTTPRHHTHADDLPLQIGVAREGENNAE